MNSIAAMLDTHRDRLSLESYGLSGRLSCVVKTPRFRASRHIVVLVHPFGSSRPTLVAKIPRLGGDHAAVEREGTNLRMVHALRPTGFDSIPRFVAFLPCHERLVLVETVLSGPPIDPPAVRRNRTLCSAAIVDWLSELHGLAPRASTVDQDWFERLVDTPLEHLASCLPYSAAESHLLQQTRVAAQQLRNEDPPLVFEHGDLSHPNLVFIESGRAGVLDWETAEPHGLPACDLFFYLVYAALANARARTAADCEKCFRETFLDRSSWAQPWIREYAARLGLPQRMLAPLLVLTLARYVDALLVRLMDERVDHPAEDELAEWLRSNRFYHLWRYSLRHMSELF